MENAINFLVLVFLAVIFTAFVAWLLAAVAFAFRVRQWRRWALASPLVSAALIFGCSQWASSPNRVFQREFGFPAPPQVTVHGSSTRAFGDFGCTFLHFSADPPTVQRIASGLWEGGTPVSINLEPPSWWTPQLDGAKQYTHSTGLGAKTNLPSKGFSSENRWLIYDTRSGEVWYRYTGID